MLAHELTHVVQQQSGIISRQVQRASIPYRQLTWNDFQGSAPASTTLSAETSSGFDPPAWKPTVTATDTGVGCEVSGKKTTRYTVTLSINPAVFDTLVAKMEQGRSWVLSKFKNPTTHCTGLTTTCQTEIDKQVAGATTNCKGHTVPCQEAFDNGNTRYTIEIDGTSVVATSRGACATTLVSDCQKAAAKSHLFEITEKDTGVQVVRAASRADCSSKKFSDDCLKYYKDWSARLLKHEQGHFDISKVMADKAQADLKTKSAKFKGTATECGKTQANNAAVAAWDALTPGTEIAKIGQDWIDLKDKAQKDYDTDTSNGLKAAEQATWEGKITAKLVDYDLNKPATPAPGQQTPQTNPPPNPGIAIGRTEGEEARVRVAVPSPGNEE
jgi:hypothetical protein